LNDKRFFINKISDNQSFRLLTFVLPSKDMILGVNKQHQLSKFITFL
jgi:hypothetical protein